MMLSSMPYLCYKYTLQTYRYLPEDICMYPELKESIFENEYFIKDNFKFPYNQWFPRNFDRNKILINAINKI